MTLETLTVLFFQYKLQNNNYCSTYIKFLQKFNFSTNKTKKNTNVDKCLYFQLLLLEIINQFFKYANELKWLKNSYFGYTVNQWIVI